MEFGRFGTPIAYRDLDEDVFGRGLGVLDKDVEVAIIVEHPGVDEFEFALVAPAAAVFLDQRRVGKFALRILVQRLEIGSGRRGVEVEVTFLDVLAVVPFIPGQPEQTLLEDWIAAVPQRDSEAQAASAVADSQQRAPPPPIGPAPPPVPPQKFPAGAPPPPTTR